MKLKALLVSLFVAGVVASFAIAKPPPGKGNPHTNVGTTAGSTSASTSTGITTTTATAGRKVLVCHLTGKGKLVLVSVSANSAHTRKHKGDVPAAGGKCPSPKTGTGTTQTGTTQTTGTTGTTSG